MEHEWESVDVGDHIEWQCKHCLQVNPYPSETPEGKCFARETIFLREKLTEAEQKLELATQLIKDFYKYRESLNHVHLPPYGREGNILYASRVYDVLEELKKET